MRCPICANEETRVIDSRVSTDGLGVRRRRECNKCDYRFSTVEAVEIFDLVIIKRDGRRESYQRDKIESGLRRALEKRPYTTDGFRGLVGVIEQDIQRKRQTEIASREIGEIVMKHLRNFDLVGYMRFASVYRSFTDIQSFREEIEKLPSKKN